MKAFAQFGVLVLLLLSCLVPALACVVPNAQRNAQERVCCRIMKSQCGQITMSAAHSCCQKIPSSAYGNAQYTKTVTFHSDAAAMLLLAAFDSVNPAPAVIGWAGHSEDSPPTSPPANISILRI
jgi:hypothetical protein